MEKDSKIYIAGHTGLVGSAVYRALQRQGYSRLIVRTHPELDLTNQAATNAFFEQERPEHVFLAAARVGGIVGNSTYPAEFIYTNLAIGTNIVHACYKYGVNLYTFCMKYIEWFWQSPEIWPKSRKSRNEETNLFTPKEYL